MQENLPSVKLPSQLVLSALLHSGICPVELEGWQQNYQGGSLHSCMLKFSTAVFSSAWDSLLCMRSTTIGMTVLRTAVEIDCALSACVLLQAQNMFHCSLCIPSRRTMYNTYKPVWLISSELSAFNLPLESWGVPQGCSLILVMFVLTLLFGKIHSGLIISVISSWPAAVRVPFSVWNSAKTNPVTCYYNTYMRMFLVFYNLWWWSAQKCSSLKCSLTCDTHETVNSHVHTVRIMLVQIYL